MAQRKLPGSTLSNKTGYDLEWNGQRIEVKTSRSQYKDQGHVFDIRIQKREGKADYFLALILDDKKELRYAYLIPNKAISAKTNLHIYPGRSKYDRWRLRLNQYGRKDTHSQHAGL